MLAEEGDESVQDIVLLCWTSKKIKRVVRSTFSGELLQQSEALDCVMWLKGLLLEMTDLSISIDMLTDCQSLVDSLKSLRLRPKEKRLTVELSLLKEAQQNNDVRSIRHIPTGLMIADGLTKDQSKLRLNLCKLLGGSVTMFKPEERLEDELTQTVYTAYLCTLLSSVDSQSTDLHLPPPPPSHPPPGHHCLTQQTFDL